MAENFMLKAGPVIPNNPNFPVVLMRSVLAADMPDMAEAFEKAFKAQAWQGLWWDGIYDYHHFHSTAHEVLGIAAGQVTVRLGGEETGRNVDLKAGDLVVLPAGTGHKKLQASDDLLVVGAYPPGQEPDLCRHIADDPGIVHRIAGLPAPRQDPFYGDGPLTILWSEKKTAASF